MAKLQKKWKLAFVDGSAFNDTNKYGAGWVITNHKGNKPIAGCIRLSFNRANSLIAEIHAASAALNTLKENSRVVVLTDCAAVSAAIALNDFPERIKRARSNILLQKSWALLDRSIKQHEEVSVHFMQTSDHPLMQAAHYKAQEGAAKPFSKSSDQDFHSLRKKGGGYKQRYIWSELEDSPYTNGALKLTGT